MPPQAFHNRSWFEYRLLLSVLAIGIIIVIIAVVAVRRSQPLTSTERKELSREEVLQRLTVTAPPTQETIKAYLKELDKKAVR